MKIYTHFYGIVVSKANDFYTSPKCKLWIGNSDHSYKMEAHLCFEDLYCF